MTEPEPVDGAFEPSQSGVLEIAEVAPEEPGRTPPPPPAKPRRSFVAPAIYAFCIIVLISAGVWVWLNPDVLTGGGTPDGNPQIATLQQQIRDLSERVARLEAAPTPMPPQAPPPATAASPAPSAAPVVDVQALEARLTALEQRPVPAPAPPPPAPAVSSDDVAALRNQVANDDQKLAAIGQTLAALGDRVQGSDSQTSAQLQALQGRLESTDKLSSQVSGLAARATRLTQVQAAGAALAAGKPLGTIADAPPALARFAVTPPPTEAVLRLQFPALSAQALASAGPDAGDKPFLDRVWGRVQQAVTIRAGERIIVGNPAAAILAAAQDALDAGDLAAAVADLKKLPTDAAAPLAGWIDQATALLAARAALADIAARA